MRKFRLPIVMLFFLPSFQLRALSQDRQEWKTISPDGSLQIVLSLESGKLSYRVQEGSQILVRSSSLGIVCADESFADSLSFLKISAPKIRREYLMKIGKRAINEDAFSESTVSFNHHGKEGLVIDCRAYNDGVAFRYRLGGPERSIMVIGENTAFSIDGGRIWAENYEMPSSYAPAYENDYVNGIPVGFPAKAESGWAFPLLVNSHDHWLLVTETNLKSNYFGSHLHQQAENGEYKIAGPLAGEALGKYPVSATANTPFETPWRLIMVGKTPAAIVESNLVYSLADPSAIADDTWIKPGIASWSWWSDHPSSKNFSKLKDYVDLAAEMGWAYSLVDANWNIMQGGGNIEDLLKYAASKKIGLSLWYNSGGPHNNVTEQPRDIMNDPDKRKAEFKKLEEWGVKAVKVDFFQSDKQEIIKLYLDILKDAADRHIMVIFHGCTLPRGWSRTWPNLLSMEAVKGAEQYGWDSAFAHHAATHNVILAFTRNVVGPMDYTPVTFSSYPCCKHATTNAHELALSVIFESGMMHFADSKSSYESQAPEIRHFLATVPNTWDETRFISGEPGKDIVLARRKGNDWYIAGINGEDHPKTISVNLSLLENAAFQGMLFFDGDGPEKIKTGNKDYPQKGSLTVNLLPYGGFAAKLVGRK